MKPQDAVPETSDSPTPTDEQFAEWCQNPVTRYVASAFKQMIEDEKYIWANMTWNSPKPDPDVNRTLVAAKATAKAYEIFITAKKEHYVGVNSRSAQKKHR